MSLSSTQITAQLNQDVNPEHKEYELFLNCRYLVSHVPADTNYSDTNTEYFNGKHVIPGPKADPKLMPPLSLPDNFTVDDFKYLKTTMHIRFTDYTHTSGAEVDVRRSIYTLMTNQEAEHYEKILREQVKINANRLSKVPSSAAK